MKELRLSDRRLSPLTLEGEILRKLASSGVCAPERLRLTIAGRWLFVDGFVDSLSQKVLTEKACRALAPDNTVVNRLRVAASEERQVS